MNIKRTLTIIIICTLLVLLTFSVVIYNSLQNYKKASQKAAIATQIALEVYTRRLVADDYLLNPGERAKSQWLSKQATTEELVTSQAHNFDTSGEKPLIDAIKSG